MALSLTAVAVLALAIFVAGALNGVAGFGFALLGTTVLATVLDPATAVVFMILPIVGVNLALAREVSTATLRSCGARFGPLIVAAMVGTILGMVVIEWLPDRALRVALGVLALAYVVGDQRVVSLPGRSTLEERCFVETPLAMAGVGSLSGFLFGGTNVGVQLIAFLRSCNLNHRLFVAVVAVIFLGLNGIRVLIAGTLGLYPSWAIVGASLAAALPAVAGVAVGQQLRPHLSIQHRRYLVLALITGVGLRLLMVGIGF